MKGFKELFDINLQSQTIIGVAAIILGCGAISAPFITGIFFSMFLAIAMCALGVTGVIWLFKEEKTSTKLWMALLSILLIISSFFMYMLPGATLMFSSGVLITFFFIEGLITMFYGIKQRKQKGAGWSIFYGLLSVVCAGFLVADWPLTGLFAIGIYVGIKLVYLGIGVLAVTFAEQRIADDVENELNDNKAHA